MRGTDTQQSGMFSYLSPEERVPERHPLRAIRRMTDEVLQGLSAKFNELYSASGRPSIAPEKLLRALLLQILYTVRSERLLMEQLQYNLLFRWFVGLNMDEPSLASPLTPSTASPNFWRITGLLPTLRLRAPCHTRRKHSGDISQPRTRQ
ncbi:MAG: transposase [Bryobacteraceae bacterium]